MLEASSGFCLNDPSTFLPFSTNNSALKLLTQTARLFRPGVPDVSARKMPNFELENARFLDLLNKFGIMPMPKMPVT